MTACKENRWSWLALEEYHLGEAPIEKQARIARHLVDCGDCRERLESIENDLYALPPLPAVELKTRLALPRFGLAWASGALAAAAVATVIVLSMVLPQGSILPEQTISFKGGDLAMTLVRKRDGEVLENPIGFQEGDQFIARLTCPGTDAVVWDVVVFQNGAAFFPYAARPSVQCGNNVPLPGAFSVTGLQPVTICVMIEDLPPREELKVNGVNALSKGSVCTVLKPLP